MRHYGGVIADSSRWARIPTRPGDIVISSPSKSGTTWVQQIVVRLVLGRSDLDRPVSDISPWFDSLLHTDAEIEALLGSQDHRRVLKTHTPLDGLPDVPGVRFVALARHPLDVALSFRDHVANLDMASVRARLATVAGEPGDPPAGPPPERSSAAPPEPPPPDDADFLAWWIAAEAEPTAAGPGGLSEFCNSIEQAWSRRGRDDVHLLHYDDLLADSEAEIRSLAEFLGLDADDDLVGAIARATSFDRLRADATTTVPFAGLNSFVDPQGFFPVGGARHGASLLDRDAKEAFDRQMSVLEPAARRWALGGNRLVDS